MVKSGNFTKVVKELINTKEAVNLIERINNIESEEKNKERRKNTNITYKLKLENK